MVGGVRRFRERRHLAPESASPAERMVHDYSGAWRSPHPCCRERGAPLTPRGHSMSPKMFLMQPTRYSCRSSVTPSKFLHARMTTSRGWPSSHSEISVSVSWAGVARRASCERRRGVGGGFPQHDHSTDGSGGPDTERHRARRLLPRDPASPEWQRGAVGVCTRSCGYGAHTCVHVVRACVCTDVRVCARTAAGSSAHRLVWSVHCRERARPAGCVHTQAQGRRPQTPRVAGVYGGGTGAVARGSRAVTRRPRGWTGHRKTR